MIKRWCIKKTPFSECLEETIKRDKTIKIPNQFTQILMLRFV